MANDIAVSMYLNNQKYMQGMSASKGALVIYNKQLGLSQRTQEHFEQTLHQSSNAFRINQSAMSNAIFMAEDMSSVYGTSGLAGAIRAGSNNLTMMLAPLGGWVMAAGVATTAALQLYLAFNKDAEGAKNARDKVDEYKDALDEQAGRIDRLTRLRRQLGRAESSSETGGLKQQVQDDIASIDAQIAAFEKQKKAAQERQAELQKRGQSFEQAAKDNPMSSAGVAAKAAYDAAKEQAAKVEELENRRQKLIEERAQKEQEAAMIAQRHNAIVRREVVQANQEQIAAVDEQIQKDREAADAAIQNQQRVKDNARKNTDDERRMKQQFERRSVAQSTVRGSRDFALAFARTAQSNTAGLSKRELASQQAMERKRAQFMQNDRGLFGDRRKKEAWNIAEQQRWKVDNNFRQMALGYEFSDKYVSPSQKMKNRERLGPAWDQYNQRTAAEAVARKKEKINNAPREQVKEQMADQKQVSEKLAKSQEEATNSMNELTEQIREQNRLASQRPSDLSLSLGALGG